MAPYSVYAYSDDDNSSLRGFSFAYTSILSAASNLGHRGNDEDMSSPSLGNCAPNDVLSVTTGTRIDNITGSLTSTIDSNPLTYTSALVGPALLRWHEKQMYELSICGWLCCDLRSLGGHIASRKCQYGWQELTDPWIVFHDTITLRGNICLEVATIAMIRAHRSERIVICVSLL